MKKKNPSKTRLLATLLSSTLLLGTFSGKTSEFQVYASSEKNHVAVGESSFSTYAETTSQTPSSLKNPEFIFTTLDREKISSTEGENPKLIIFFGGECSISQRTMNNLIIEQYPGIDIYAIEANFKTLDTTKTFRDSWMNNGPGKEDTDK